MGEWPCEIASVFLIAFTFRCDKEYFVDEVGLTSVPKGDWFCVKCVEKSSKKGGKTKAAAATAEPAATKGRTRRG